MKIVDEIKGKEVIAASGNKVGEVNDVEWNFENNMVEFLIVTEGGASAKIGLGEKKVIAYEMIESIGDKILLKK